jgi:hypothetical protein
LFIFDGVLRRIAVPRSAFRIEGCVFKTEGFGLCGGLYDD